MPTIKPQPAPDPNAPKKLAWFLVLALAGAGLLGWWLTHPAKAPPPAKKPAVKRKR
jgi:hypothetical protein